MSDSEDTIITTSGSISSDESECSVSQNEEPDGPNLFDLLSDEIVLEIVNWTDFWSRENLRATCVRMKNMIDGEVRELTINREWVERTFRPRRFSYLRCSNKRSKSYLLPELRQIRKEQMITQYIVRHPLLQSLFFYNCGMSLVHNNKHYQQQFTRQLASNCTMIQEMLVCGSTGLRILISYLNFMRELDHEPKLQIIRLNPYEASGIIANYLIQALQKCPNLQKIVLFATSFGGVPETFLMKHEKKMISFLTACNEHRLKSLVTCFRTEHSFKTAAIDHLSNMDELVFSGPYGTDTEFVSEDSPMTASNMSLLCEMNPSLRTLKVYLHPSACDHFSKLQLLEKLILVLESRNKAAYEHVFSSSRPHLSVLGLTFLSCDPHRSSFQINLSNCPNLEVFAVTFKDETTVTAVHILKLAAALLKNLRELYYTNSAAESLNDPEVGHCLTRVFFSCRSLHRIYLNNNLYVRADDRMVFKRGLVQDPRQLMERELFC